MVFTPFPIRLILCTLVDGDRFNFTRLVVRCELLRFDYVKIVAIIKSNESNGID